MDDLLKQIINDSGITEIATVTYGDDNDNNLSR